MFDPIEGVNIFSNPERGIRPSELIKALQEIPDDISLVCSKVLNINMIKDNVTVGRIELNNFITGIENNRVVADISMLQETFSTVERDPGSTGGDQVTFDETTNTFSGTVAYYEADEGGFPPTAGNYVGVQITPPEGTEVDRNTATFTYVNAKGKKTTLVNGTNAWLEEDGDYVWYYPLVDGSRRIFEIEINWNPLKYKSESIVITVSDDAVLAVE